MPESATGAADEVAVEFSELPEQAVNDTHARRIGTIRENRRYVGIILRS